MRAMASARWIGKNARENVPFGRVSRCAAFVRQSGTLQVAGLSSPLKNACCLRALHPGRSLRRADCVESADSTSSALLDLDPASRLSATQPFFNGLLACAPHGDARMGAEAVAAGGRRDRVAAVRRGVAAFAHSGDGVCGAVAATLCDRSP